MTNSHQKKASIIGTIGPTSIDKGVLEDLFHHGLDITRINLSHGDQATAKKWFETIRSVDDTVPIMFDLSGPKMRIGEIKSKLVHLVTGNTFVLSKEKVSGTVEKVGTTYPELIDLASVGNTIYLNDGLIELKVKEKRDEELVCKIVRGGPLSSRKGINAPEVPIKLYAPTDKDIKDIEFTKELEPDFYSVSFVRRIEDLLKVRGMLSDMSYQPPLISKIEHSDGVRNFDEILKVTDVVMVARGDLGVELDPADIPLLQKKLIKKCNQVGKPVIVATQMLETMVSSPRPTRAEASDVANAILDGADTVMLSAETATGMYPVKAVDVMSRIIKKVQGNVNALQVKFDPTLSPKWDAVANAAVILANSLNAKAIIANTRSGDTARAISKYRPTQPIISITPELHTFRKLAIYWGVVPELLEQNYSDTDDMIAASINLAFKKGYIQKDDIVVSVAGSLLGLPYTTNLVQYHLVSDILNART